MKKNFSKNLIMIEEQVKFQSSNTCWICEELIDHENVRDHRHITLKFRGASHWSCSIFNLIKKGPVIFHNLRGYDSHLIFNELKKFDVKIDVIPNGYEKYMAFILKKKYVIYEF